MKGIDLSEFLNSGAIVSLNSSLLMLGYGKKICTREPLQFPCWYFPDFFLQGEKPYFSFSHTYCISPQELRKILNLNPGSIAPIKWENPNWSLFQEHFKKLQIEMGSKKLIKAVPYVSVNAYHSIDQNFFSHCLEGALSYHLLHPSTAIYGCWDKNEGLLGVTPELLCSYEGGRKIKTMACAGTVKGEQEEIFEEDSKLIEEHAIVIQGIEAQLEGFGKVHIGRTAPVSFGSLSHLVTSIEVDLSERIPIKKIIEKIHPTPALGAWPLDYGREWLKRYALAFPRKHFGAPVGIFPQRGKGSVYVAIRGIEWAKGKITLSAGCGVVEKSVFEKERAELEAKLRTVQDFLKL